MDSGRVAGLVRDAAAGDRGAWDELVDGFSGLLWSVIAAYRLDRADAADVLQTTWLRLLENLDRLRDPTHVGAWLATTARRECLRALRQARRVLPVPDAEQLEPGTATEITPERALLDSERDETLWSAFGELPENCQKLLRMLVEDSPPYAEVASALGMPVGSIGPTRARCLDRLRRRLGESGISMEPGDS
jgi:RNA polymerase sigma factor (sigma-70 family)